MPKLLNPLQGPDFVEILITPCVFTANADGTATIEPDNVSDDLSARILTGGPELVRNLRHVGPVNRKKLNNVIETEGVRFTCTALLTYGNTETDQANGAFWRYLGTSADLPRYSLVTGAFGPDEYFGYFIVGAVRGGITDRAENTYEITFEPIDTLDVEQFNSPGNVIEG